MIDEPLEDDDGIDDLLATAEALAPSAPRTWVSPAKASGAPRDSSSLFGDQEAEAAAFAHAAETGHDTSALDSALVANRRLRARERLCPDPESGVRSCVASSGARPGRCTRHASWHALCQSTRCF